MNDTWLQSPSTCKSDNYYDKFDKYNKLVLKKTVILGNINKRIERKNFSDTSKTCEEDGEEHEEDGLRENDDEREEGEQSGQLLIPCSVSSTCALHTFVSLFM